MIYLDLALRSGAITIMLVLAISLWRAPIGWEGRLSISALAISNSCFLILTTALPLDLHPVVSANLKLFASFLPAAITWLIVTIFLETPKRRGPWLIASLATSGALYVSLSIPGIFPYCVPMSVALYGALFVLSLWSARDDLVECRCHARPGFAAAIAGVSLLITAGQLTGMLGQNTMPLALIQGFGTLVVALAFAFWLLRADASRWPGETTINMKAHAPLQDKFDDPALITRIQTVMDESIWKEEGLTIGALAGKLAVPEHRLRRAINQGLGYRNFSSFVNRARIEAACAALTDPEQIGTTVLEIAYDVGFSSMGPFNRAFRAEIGQSPTEYRRISQSQACTDSEISSLKAVKLH